MEALRILAMSMILVYHFFVNAITPGSVPHNLYFIVKFFVFSGVNIFFLLSGYFTINYSTRGFIRLVAFISIFGLLNLLATCLVGAVPPPNAWLHAIFYPVSGSTYWFMKVYVLLYLSSPILTAGLRALSGHQLRNVLILWLLYIFYMRGNAASYTYLQGVFLYCTGYYLHHNDFLPRVGKGAWLAIYFISCALLALSCYTCTANGWTIPDRLFYFHSYSNPLLVLSAVSMLMFFSKLDFTSLRVNVIASASLGCYLLQDGYFGFAYIYFRQRAVLEEYGYGLHLLLMFVMCFIAFWLLSLLLTTLINLWLPSASAAVDSALRRIIKRK